MIDLFILLFNLVLVLATAYCVVHIAKKRVDKEALDEHMKSDRIFNAINEFGKQDKEDK